MEADARDVVVVGASAGGVEALQELMRGLPPEFPATVLVVLHVLPTGTSMLPDLLGRAGKLPVEFAKEGQELQRGRVFVAPPDHHLVVEDGRLALNRGPLESGVRPSVDTLFRSAARSLGPRVVGVILSGALHDGAAGLRLIKENGGVAVAQKPSDAVYPGMPMSAADAVELDRVLPVKEMGAALCELVEAS
jgi:two-component system, chemotaxis family, protein-glutamate methylesterase/glutaminase